MLGDEYSDITGSRMSAVGKILGVDSRNKRHFAFTESNLQDG